jgi:uncharacterized OsmC-like protein
MSDISVMALQTPLRQQYVAAPEKARVTDWATTSSNNHQDPFHAVVEPMQGCGIKVPVGVHAALGGPHDAPTPGDILCAALAACLDSSIRMIANIMGIELDHLQVKVTAQVDVRGALAMSKEVPVGFQEMKSEVEIRVKKGTDEKLVERLKIAAERSCVVLQTLRNPPPVEVQFSRSQ